MANITTDFSAGRKPMPYPNDQCVVLLMFDYAPAFGPGVCTQRHD